MAAKLLKRLGIYLEPDLLDWLKQQARAENRTAPKQAVYILMQAKKATEK